MRPMKPGRRDFTNSEKAVVMAQLDRMEKGLNRLLAQADLPQTGKNGV